jgi:hypothetical protein
MKRMHWDFDQLQACPVYVRNYIVDFLEMEDEARNKPAPSGDVVPRNPDAWADANG